MNSHSRVFPEAGLKLSDDFADGIIDDGDDVDSMDELAEDGGIGGSSANKNYISEYSNLYTDARDIDQFLPGRVGGGDNGMSGFDDDEVEDMGDLGDTAAAEDFEEVEDSHFRYGGHNAHKSTANVGFTDNAGQLDALLLNDEANLEAATHLRGEELAAFASTRSLQDSQGRRASISGNANQSGDNVDDVEVMSEDGDVDEEVDFGGTAQELAELEQALPPGQAAMAGLVADPEFENRITQLVDTTKLLKARLADLRTKHKEVLAEKKVLKENLIKMEHEKEEAALIAERELRMLQYKSLTGGDKKQGNRANELEQQKKREEQRRAMYSGDQDDEEMEFGDHENDHRGFLTTFYRRTIKWLRKRYPLSADLRRVDARFGSSVASYFFFFRWMIMNYATIAALCIVFLIKHLIKLFQFQALDATQRAAQWNTINEPLVYYLWTAEYWGQVSGFLPKFMMYSSFNPGDSASIYVDDESLYGTGAAAITNKMANLLLANGSTTAFEPYNYGAAYGERLDYAMMILICNLTIIISAARKWVVEDRKATAFEVFEETDGKAKYAKLALNVWDHSLRKEGDVEDLKYATHEAFIVALNDEKTSLLSKSRTLQQRAILIARRVIANLMYLAIQATSAGIIIAMTLTSSDLRVQILEGIRVSGLTWAQPFAELISGSLVPLVVAVINGITPAFFTILTVQEKWDDEGFRTKLMLFRLFVAKNLNVLIQIFSFVQLIDPYIFRYPTIIPASISATVRISTEKRFGISGADYATASTHPRGMDECRSDWYGFGVFQLVVTDFVVTKISKVVAPLIGKLVARVRKKPWVKQEFDVAKEMVNLLFFQQLCFMSFPLFPFGSIFILFMALANFKYNKLILEAFMQKPKVPWGAKDAANFFIKFFFITYIISGVITLFILTNSNFPKACTLQQAISTSQFTMAGVTTYPLEQCYTSTATDAQACWMDHRTKAQVAAGTSVAGMEELRFWEEYFALTDVTTVPSLADSDKIPVAALLRAMTGHSSATAVRDSTLMVCSLACGPFLYNTNAYQPVDRALTYHFTTIYTLAGTF
jgi:hypothetical protein